MRRRFRSYLAIAGALLGLSAPGLVSTAPLQASAAPPDLPRASAHVSAYVSAADRAGFNKALVRYLTQRGFQTNPGYPLLYVSIFRESDGYECTSFCEDSAEKVRDMVKHMRARVDAEQAAAVGVEDELEQPLRVEGALDGAERLVELAAEQRMAADVHDDRVANDPRVAYKSDGNPEERIES